MLFHKLCEDLFIWPIWSMRHRNKYDVQWEITHLLLTLFHVCHSLKMICTQLMIVMYFIECDSVSVEWQHQIYKKNINIWWCMWSLSVYGNIYLSTISKVNKKCFTLCASECLCICNSQSKKNVYFIDSYRVLLLLPLLLLTFILFWCQRKY